MSNFSSLLLDTVKFDVFVCLVNMIFLLLLLLSPEGLISSIALESQSASLSFPSPSPNRWLYVPRGSSLKCHPHG